MKRRIKKVTWQKVIVMGLFIITCCSACFEVFPDLITDPDETPTATPYPSPTPITTSGPDVPEVLVWCIIDESLWVVNGETGEYINIISFPEGTIAGGIEILPNDRDFYLTDRGNRKIYYVENDRIAATIDRLDEDGLGGFNIHPNSEFAYVSSFSGTLIVNTDKNSPSFNNVILYPEFGVGEEIFFVPQSTWAYTLVDGYWGSISEVWPINTITHTIVEPVISLEAGSCPTGGAITLYGTRLYVTG